MLTNTGAALLVVIMVVLGVVRRSVHRPIKSLTTTLETLGAGDYSARAEHRGWIEFGSAVLNDIAGFYAAKDEATFKAKAKQLAEKLARLEARISAPWFDGEKFSLVDAVFGPVFRYFDVFDEIGDFGILAGKPKLAQWRKNLAARPSVRSAVSTDYPALLRDFIDRRQSWLSQLQAGKRKAA